MLAAIVHIVVMKKLTAELVTKQWNMVVYNGEGALGTAWLLVHVYTMHYQYCSMRLRIHNTWFCSQASTSRMETQGSQPWLAVGHCIQCPHFQQSLVASAPSQASFMPEEGGVSYIDLMLCSL